MSNPQAEALLSAAKAATFAGSYIFANPKSPTVKGLVAAGHLTINGDIANPDNPDQVAVRATDEAMAMADVVTNGSGSAPLVQAPGVVTLSASTPRPARTAISVDEPMSLIKSKRGGARPETYPFATLAAPVDKENGPYASFFVAASTAMPDPARSLASTVSSATKRYGDRKFVIRAVESDPKYGVKGARIFRIE